MEHESISMEVINTKAAEVNVDICSHWVAIEQLEKDVKEFGVFLMKPFIKWPPSYKKIRSKPSPWKALVKPLCNNERYETKGC